MNDLWLSIVNLTPVPDQWTKIPVLVKIYKLLINELSNAIEANMSTQVSAGDDEEDDVQVRDQRYLYLTLQARSHSDYNAKMEFCLCHGNINTAREDEGTSKFVCTVCTVQTKDF